MRLKGEVGKWREMERFEWKVGVETAFFCAAASFLFFSGECQVLADGGGGHGQKGGLRARGQGSQTVGQGTWYKGILPSAGTKLTGV